LGASTFSVIPYETHPTNGSDDAAFWPLEEIAMTSAMVDIVRARRVVNFVTLQLRVGSVFRLKYTEKSRCEDSATPEPLVSSGLAGCVLCISLTSILAHRVTAHLDAVSVVD
jgi:hypothetical protein